MYAVCRIDVIQQFPLLVILCNAASCPRILNLSCSTKGEVRRLEDFISLEKWKLINKANESALIQQLHGSWLTMWYYISGHLICNIVDSLDTPHIVWAIIPSSGLTKNTTHKNNSSF